jgi:iron complex transport system substrate-binding protein
MTSPYTPRRVVSLQPSATVILHAIGQLDRVIACTKYCVDVCPQAAAGRILVDDSWTAKADQIIAAKPDLVIAAVPYQEKAVAEILKSGARFLGLAPKSLADLYTDIVMIAGVMSESGRGEDVVASMREEIEQMRSQTLTLRRPLVFCEEWGKPLIASQSWVAELVEAAGGTFLGKPGVQHSFEKIAAQDPDVLIAAWCGAGDRVPLEKVVRARGWDKLRAVLAGHVYCIRDEFLNTPAPTLLSGLHALAAAIHPEHFPRVAGLRSIADVSF